MNTNPNRRILESFDITLEDYLKLDKDVRIAILRGYWDKKISDKHNQEEVNKFKIKVLNLIKKNI